MEREEWFGGRHGHFERRGEGKGGRKEGRDAGSKKWNVGMRVMNDGERHTLTLSHRRLHEWFDGSKGSAGHCVWLMMILVMMMMVNDAAWRPQHK